MPRSYPFHLDPETGRADVCGTYDRGCPLGGESGTDNHYFSLRELLKAKRAWEVRDRDRRHINYRLRDPASSPDLLADYAVHPYPTYRRWVAENPSTPQELLDHLARDTDEAVVVAAIGNPSTREDTLWRLQFRTYRFESPVWIALAKRLAPQVIEENSNEKQAGREFRLRVLWNRLEKVRTVPGAVARLRQLIEEEASCGGVGLRREVTSDQAFPVSDGPECAMIEKP